MAAILCSFSSQVTNNGLLIVWKTPAQLCPLFWWNGRKVQSSMMAPLLLFLEQGTGVVACSTSLFQKFRLAHHAVSWQTES